jgi:hypothetical protein
VTPDYILSTVERAASGDAFARGSCFACGGKPTTGKGEHVIPGWLQKRFNLYNQRLTLLNGTFLPYRKLTIPCCQSCNNGFLRTIENRVMVSLADPDLEDDDTRLNFARWLCKILIGVLVKEAELPRDRSSPETGNIVTPEFLEEFMHAQLLLQSARKRTVFHSLHGVFPFTLYMYCIAPDERFGQFDLSTNMAGQSIAMRLGNLGAIFVNDGGLQLVAGAKGPHGLDGRELHPLQFSEVAARVHYKATLRDATHSYISFETPDELTIEQQAVRPYTRILVDGGAQRVFRPWDDIECAHLIERYRPKDIGPAYDAATGMFWTTLIDEYGNLLSPSIIAGRPPFDPSI